MDKGVLGATGAAGVRSAIATWLCGDDTAALDTGVRCGVGFGGTALIAGLVAAPHAPAATGFGSTATGPLLACT